MKLPCLILVLYNSLRIHSIATNPAGSSYFYTITSHNPRSLPNNSTIAYQYQNVEQQQLQYPRKIMGNVQDIQGHHQISAAVFGLDGTEYEGQIGEVPDPKVNRRIRRELNRNRARKQKEREEQFDLLARKLLPISLQSIAIIQLPFEELRRKLQTRELTATSVLSAYVAKALTVTSDFNCVTEFVPYMWALAEELDRLPHVTGPLHGIPVGIKDEHDIAGMDSTLGLSVNLYKPATNHSTVVQILLDAGAVPFAKTNLPQTTFSIASDNPIFGTSVNHLNKRLGPGGSSSGSACLVGAGGAPFATGSDIGGSVRIPAHFSGISTLTPTVSRISSKGIVPGIAGVAGVAGVSGILAQSIRTVATVFSTLTYNSLQNQYDPLLPAIPWNNQLYESRQPLRIGYYTSISFFPALGDTPETIVKAKVALESLGHTVIPFDLPDTYHMMEVFNTLTGADGGNQNFQKLRNDLVSPPGQKFTCGREDGITYYGEAAHSPCVSRGKRDLRGNPDAQRSEVLWDYLTEQNRIKNDILDRMDKLKLDLILSPVYPFPAPPIENADILLNGFVYTAIWNLVQFPAGNVPFGHETLAKIYNYDDEGDFYLRLAKKGIMLSKGMPIGVQIVGKPFKEEMVLRVLSELENYKAQTGLQ